MHISINANYFGQRRDGAPMRNADERIKLCVDAGFRVLDYSVNAWSDGWEAETEAIMNAAAKHGAIIEQSHAPYNFYIKAPIETYHEALDRSVEAAIKMGAQSLVFHADEYRPPEGTPYRSEEGLVRAYDVLAPHIEKLVRGGVKAALETVFEDRTLKPVEGKRYHFCGDINELIAMIDKFNDPMVGCCWDSGHTKLSVGNDGHVDALRRLGSRIICTHIHDNYYGKDLHVQPFMGDANWEELMPALKATGYDGSLTFELVYGCMHEELLTAWLDQLYHTGELLRAMFEA
ncbi:MAG: sugar phosphate isomerase/epimerase [Clostridia bacterium]|nr:sugar phosphate isomerase/epimerase [Clostridia bacterium]